MPVEIKKIEALFKELYNPPEIVIDDREFENQYNDWEGKTSTIPELRYGSVNINPKLYYSDLYNFYLDFKSEFDNNRYIQDFSIEAYLQRGLEYAQDILSKFYLLKYSDIEYFWRIDLKLKYREITDEIEYSEDGDDGIHSWFKTKMIDITDYSVLPVSTLQTISKIISHQKQITERTLSLLSRYPEYKLTKTTYGTNYRYTYFKFTSLNHLGSRQEINEYKKEFFIALTNSKYCNKGDYLILEKFFNDLPSMKKAKWTGNKRELVYFINMLIEKNLIEDPLREKSRIIAQVFSDKNGRNFKPEEFHSVKPPIRTREIDDIISTLT